MASMVPAAGSRVFRPGGTLLPLFVWALLTGAAAALAIHTGLHRPEGSDARKVAWLIALIAIVFGPVAFVAHLARACLVTVCVDPDRGLVLSGRRTIPWRDVRSVEVRRPAFEGLLKPSPVVFFYSAGCLAILYYVVLPSFALFTPWHRRVIVGLAEGETLVIRDLARADEFAEEVSRRLPEAPPSRLE